MVLPYCCWGWCSGCRGAWSTITTTVIAAVIGMAAGTTMATGTTMGTATGIDIGMAMVVVTIAGMMIIATVAIAATADRPSRRQAFDNGAHGAPLCFPAESRGSVVVQVRQRMLALPGRREVGGDRSVGDIL